MNYEFLSKTLLFRGLSPEETKKITGCIGGAVKAFPKNRFILRAGDTTDDIGLIISGSINIENDDMWGNKTILSHIETGQVFAETYACLSGEPLMVSAVASEDTEVLFLSASKLLRPCSDGCDGHSLVIRNLLLATAEKNLHLSRRIFHTSSKTIRGRLLAYLSDESLRRGSRSFRIPYDRQQLADYLGVDRSALSGELAKMKRDSLITYRKSFFTLL